MEQMRPEEMPAGWPAMEDRSPQTLDEWLRAQNLTGSEFARQLGVSIMAVSEWRREQKTPSFKNRQKLYEITGLKRRFLPATQSGKT